MDAIEFVEELQRCSKYFGLHMCRFDVNVPAETVVKGISQWSKEHPEETRQSELLKMFPDAKLNDEVIDICPMKVQKDFVCQYASTGLGCFDCMKKYWLEGIKEGTSNEDSPY